MKQLVQNLSQTNRKVVFTGAALSVGAIWISVAVVNLRRTRRDQKAVAFFSELQREISPGTAGVEENKAFDMHYWESLGKKLGKAHYLLTVASAKGYAKDIKDSWGWVNDDEDKIKGVLRAVKDKAQVSQVAYQYYYLNPKEKINLIDDLKARLSSSEVGEMLDIVKKLPDYRLVETKK